MMRRLLSWGIPLLTVAVVAASAFVVGRESAPRTDPLKAARSFIVLPVDPPQGQLCSVACGDGAIACSRHVGANGERKAICWYADDRGERFGP